MRKLLVCIGLVTLFIVAGLTGSVRSQSQSQPGMPEPSIIKASVKLTRALRARGVDPRQVGEIFGYSLRVDPKVSKQLLKRFLANLTTAEEILARLRQEPPTEAFKAWQDQKVNIMSLQDECRTWAAGYAIGCEAYGGSPGECSLNADIIYCVYCMGGFYEGGSGLCF